MDSKTTNGARSSVYGVGDRVVRAIGDGCIGTIQSVRKETTAVGDPGEKALIVGVVWDNGTISYFSPAGLKPAKS